MSGKGERRVGRRAVVGANVNVEDTITGELSSNEQLVIADGRVHFNLHQGLEKKEKRRKRTYSESGGAAHGEITTDEDGTRGVTRGDGNRTRELNIGINSSISSEGSNS